MRLSFLPCHRSRPDAVFEAAGPRRSGRFIVTVTEEAKLPWVAKSGKSSLTWHIGPSPRQTGKHTWEGETVRICTDSRGTEQQRND